MVVFMLAITIPQNPVAHTKVDSISYKYGLACQAHAEAEGYIAKNINRILTPLILYILTLSRLFVFLLVSLVYSD